MSLRIFGCILIISCGIQALPQRQRQRESPDFNNNNKPGEKALRSLDQIGLEDGSIRGRSSYTDSYGNPVAYDSLDDVDAKKPSKNNENPHQYVIPGYASGILQPHEIPASGSADDQGRTIGDDKIHFVDPLNPNSFQSFNNVPSTSLSVPGIDNVNTQSPIEIPRPNIDLNETPINDPTVQTFQAPPASNPPNVPPSTILELPIDQNPADRPVFTGLVPPQIPSSDGVEIPRPNLDVHETPIDDSQNALNQGLLPPTSSPTNFNPFLNQNVPVVITDDQTAFAQKPANGLLPPKDPLPTNFQAHSTNINDLPSISTSTKFTGKFEGTLDGRTTTPAPLFIPVQVIQSHDDGKITKYTGGFGGAPGVLVSNNQINRVVPTQDSRIQPTSAPTIAAPVTRPANVHNKFTGSFGGSIGVLSPGNSLTGAPSTIQTIINPPSTLSNNLAVTTNKKATLNFGGPAGVLRPYDNLEKH